MAIKRIVVFCLVWGMAAAACNNDDCDCADSETTSSDTGVRDTGTSSGTQADTGTSSGTQADTGTSSGSQGDTLTSSQTDTGQNTDTSSTSDTSSSSESSWLHTADNRIYTESGDIWIGRGANIHDTRSCWGCSWNEPNPGEVMRRLDALIDDWGANFVRLALESYAAPSDEWMVQWQGVLDDPEYLADIVEIVDHIGSKPGTYVLLSLWVDPTFNEYGWPTSETAEVWEKLAQTFAFDSHVLYGLVNEPEFNYDGSMDAEVWQAMNDTVEAIRAVEDELGAPHHIVAVQGTGGWSRFLQYYIDHPITASSGENVAYEVHVYDPQSEFQDRFVTPSQSLPVIVGEFGPAQDAGMTEAHCEALMPLAESNGVSWLAWTFHPSCPPNLLENTAGSCGEGMSLVPTSWGEIVRARLAVAPGSP